MKNKEKRESMKKSLVDQIKEKKVAFAVYAVLRIIVIGVLVRSAFIGQWENVFVCLLTLVLFLLPPFIEKQFKIKLPTTLEITVFIFVFCAEILGEISCYYMKYPIWDTMLHVTSGFLFAAFGFCLLNMLNGRKNLNLTPLTLALTAFCFSMTIGVLWEFFEFGADVLLATDMQKDTIINQISTVYLDDTMTNTPVVIKDIVKTTVECADGTTVVLDGYLDIGIMDTMKDLIVDFLGTVVFSVIGYVYLRFQSSRARKIAESFIPVLADENTDDKNEG